MITEPWYADMLPRYGEEYCRIAGYFDETKTWVGQYRDVFRLPSRKIALQFSGAFHPFHEGHLSAIQTVADYFTRYHEDPVHTLVAVIHVDHSEYRNSKGACPEEAYRDGLALLHQLTIPFIVVEEDRMPDGCSRNFTRLYRELEAENPLVYFVAGGDRANYALTFRDRGHCIVSGRSSAPKYERYRYLDRETSRIVFLPGDNQTSSTDIRARLK